MSARASLDGIDVADVDVAYAKDVLRGFTTDENPAISSDAVLRAVASFFSLKPAQLKTKNNSRSIAVPRQIAMYLCKELTRQSLPQIGRDFGESTIRPSFIPSARSMRLEKTTPKFPIQ